MARPSDSILDQLGSNDPLLRRVEAVRLARAGRAPDAIAAALAIPASEVGRLVDAFARHGTLGLLTEDDFARYRAMNPRTLRFATFNLHGTHDGVADRYLHIARHLSHFAPDVIAFQEVINGDGIPDTSRQVAQRLSSLTGAQYNTHFAYCHLFMDRFPEGVALCSRHRLDRPEVIDLNLKLRDALKPSMPRFAAAAMVHLAGRRVAAASVHLDHCTDPRVRLAQAEKLVAELDRLYPDAASTVIAGDFNDVEDSPALRYLREIGFVDAYRACHPVGGNTFTTSEPQLRIDFVLARNASQILSAHTGLDDIALSDHLGVFAVVA